MKGPAVGGPLDGEEVESRIDLLRIPKSIDTKFSNPYTEAGTPIASFVDYGLYFWSPDLQMWEWDEDGQDNDSYEIDYAAILNEAMGQLTDSFKQAANNIRRSEA